MPRHHVSPEGSRATLLKKVEALIPQLKENAAGPRAGQDLRRAAAAANPPLPPTSTAKNAASPWSSATAGAAIPGLQAVIPSARTRRSPGQAGGRPGVGHQRAATVKERRCRPLTPTNSRGPPAARSRRFHMSQIELFSWSAGTNARRADDRPAVRRLHQPRPAATSGTGRRCLFPTTGCGCWSTPRRSCADSASARESTPSTPSCITHAHADHIMGLDDVRRFNASVHGGPMDVWADAAHRRGRGSLLSPTRSSSRPRKCALHRPYLIHRLIDGPFQVCGRTWPPVPLIHGANTSAWASASGDWLIART